MPRDLEDFPLELIDLIVVVGELEVHDVKNLSLVCRKFRSLMLDSVTAKHILEKTAPYSPEAERARKTDNSALELRRLAQRREAISNVKPFVVAIVARAQTWEYFNGMLLSVSGELLAMQDLHNSSRTELRVAIRPLMWIAVPASRNCERYSFKVINYAHGLVSCLFAGAQPGSHMSLVVFKPRDGKIIVTRHFGSGDKFWVRNDNRFLWWGCYLVATHPGTPQTTNFWAMQGYDLERHVWTRPVFTRRGEGSDVGVNVCFEIFDGYLYRVSTVMSSTSNGSKRLFYACYRFPANELGSIDATFNAEATYMYNNMWRSDHIEGPPDDRWTSLSMFRDEKTGTVKILEARKQWLLGQPQAKRTYYTTDIVFPSNREGGSSLFPDANTIAHSITESVSWDRAPHRVHTGDQGHHQVMFAVEDSPIRAYFPNCRAFVDLVDDPLEKYSDQQRLRLRGSYRRPRPYESTQEMRVQAGANELYSHGEVKFWPAEPRDSDQQAHQLLEAIMNHPNSLGNVRGVWDDRSFVYSTGAPNDQVVVFISFDPSIHQHGIQQYPNLQPIQWAPAIFPSSSSEGSEEKGAEKEAEVQESKGTSITADPAAQTETQAAQGIQETAVSWCTIHPVIDREKWPLAGFCFPR